MTDELLWPRLEAVIMGVVGEAALINRATRAQDVPGWNSHAMVEVILGTEEAFGFQMSSLDMESIDGVEALLAVVRRYTHEAVAR